MNSTKPTPTFRVLLAEWNTGALLQSPGVLALNMHPEDVAHLFSDLEAALAFAAATTAAHPYVECHVQEATGKPIVRVRDVDAFLRWQASQVETPRRSWWERIRKRFSRGG